MSKHDELRAIEAGVLIHLQESTAGGHALVVLPRTVFDLLYRTRPGVVHGIPLDSISHEALAEGRAEIERFINEPDWFRWPDVEFACDEATA